MVWYQGPGPDTCWNVLGGRQEEKSALFCTVKKGKIKALKKDKKAYTIIFNNGEHKLQIDKQGEYE